MIRAATPFDPLRVAVLVSGEGTNLQALIDAFAGSAQPVRIVAVASTRPGVGGLRRADTAGIPTGVFARGDDPAARDDALADWLETYAVELVVCAGWLGILSRRFLERFAAINVHPALLPAFPGMQAVDDALTHGARITGVTVFLVDSGVDTGPILLQRAVDVHYDDDPQTLRTRLHAVEHTLLPEAVRLLAADRVKINQRAVRVEDS
jgi:phosphoribosylglycinamide formyltransferase 1